MSTPIILDDLEAVSRTVAGELVTLAASAIDARGSIHIALAGGSTPRRLYEVLALPEVRDRIDWSRVHLYFGDERTVPHDHRDSNFRMAREALLDLVAIPRDQVHAIPTGPATPQDCAEAYADVLNRLLPKADGLPQLDLALLGIGDDGHTASLFPGTDILTQQDKTVAATFVPRLDTWRISLTYPTLKNARALWLLVSGPGKTDTMARIWHDPAAQLPVQVLAFLPQTRWYLDKAAAEKIVDG